MAEDRLTLLLQQALPAAVTGIDFVKIVDPDVQDTLHVYFIIEPDDLGSPLLTVPLALPEPLDPNIELRIWAPSGGRKVFEPTINSAIWKPGLNGRIVLEIVVAEPGDHSLYRLHIADSRIDYHFNNVEFSFKQGCPSTLDCKLEPVDESCPVDENDIPLDHTARDFSSIRRDLLDYAAQKFPDWTHHSDADIGVMMIELMAALGDEMSYVQDRFVREGKLGELSQRRSLRQLVRLLDYEIHDGLSPRTYLDLGVAPSAGGGAIEAGTPAWAHRLGESPIRFEVGEGLADVHSQDGDPVEFWVHENWQDLAAHEPDGAKPKLARGATEMFLVGHVPLLAEIPVGAAATGPAYWEETARMLVLYENPGDGSAPKRHIVRAKVVEHTTDPLNANAEITRIEWDEAYALPCPMVTADLTVSANIVPATAGETFEEFVSVRGDGTYPDTVEREGPLDATANTRSPVFRCSPTQSETLGLGWLGELHRANPEIEIQEVDIGDEGEWNLDKRWEWRRTLLDSVRDDQHFTIEDGTWRRIRGFRTPDGGELVHRDWAANAGYTVRFGDGEFGQVPADATTFRIRYRSGPGSTANVNADTIVLLVDPLDDNPPAPPALLESVSNPFAVTSGADREDMQRVKFLAPEAFKHDLPRAVRPDDYARLAESLTWVQKANASFRWTGSWLTVLVAADPLASYSLSARQRDELEELLDCVRQVGRDVIVLEPDFVDLDLSIGVSAKPGYYAGHVEAAVVEALTGAGGLFDSANFTFGAPLRRTRLEAAIQAVEGVSAVRSVEIRVRDLTGWEQFTNAVFAVGAGQIVRVANDRRRPERGTLWVSVTEVVG